MLRRKEKHATYCLDCGDRISSARARRCKSCAAKKRIGLGPTHQFWKGGRFQISRGYIKIYKPKHPRSIKGYVFEHMLVLEEKLGRALKSDEIGHHLNGIKNDNRPVNLIALSSRKHNLVLAAKAKRIQELEALLNNQQQLL